MKETLGNLTRTRKTREKGFQGRKHAVESRDSSRLPLAARLNPVDRSRHPLTTSSLYTVRTNLKDFVKPRPTREQSVSFSLGAQLEAGWRRPELRGSSRSATSPFSWERFLSPLLPLFLALPTTFVCPSRSSLSLNIPLALFGFSRFLPLAVRAALGGSAFTRKRREARTCPNEERGWRRIRRGIARRKGVEGWLAENREGAGTQPTEIIGCACALINLYTLPGYKHHRPSSFLPAIHAGISW